MRNYIEKRCLNWVLRQNCSRALFFLALHKWDIIQSTNHNRIFSVELNGLWSSYTGRNNLPHCTEAAKDLRVVKGLAQSQMAVEQRWSHSLPPSVWGAGSSVWARGSQHWHGAGPRLPVCPGLLACRCWSHSAQAVVHGACWHNTESCSCSYCGIYSLLMQLHRGFCDLLGSLQCSLLLSIVCRQSRIVFHVPHTQLTALDSHPTLTGQAVLLKMCQF